MEQQETQEEAPIIQIDEPKKKPFLTGPLAIIIGALIIAFAIVLTQYLFISTSRIKTVAAEAGMSSWRFYKCLDNGEYTETIDADLKNDDIDLAHVPKEQRGTPYSVILDNQNNAYEIPGYISRKTLDIIFEGIKSGAVKPNKDIHLSPITKADHTRGSKTPTYTIVEYSDTECPYCKQFHFVLQDLISSRNDVLWVYRHYPILSLHPRAFKEAEATECAAKLHGNNGFWKYIDTLFERTPSNNGFDPMFL